MKPDTYNDDLPDFVRGRLPADRARAIEAAAKDDPNLRAAIEAERSLDRLLDQWPTPEPAAGFEGRFWRRFHGDKVAARPNWLLKLAGPLAAGVLLSVGVILFVNQDPQPDPTAGQPGNEQALPVDDDPADVAEASWSDSEVEYITGGDVRPQSGRQLDLETLEMLKQLDNAAFLPLDELQSPEDLLVMDELELLRALSEDD